MSPSSTSAEIILKGYLKWGEEVITKIRGIYVIIIAAVSKNYLFCLRDRVGAYPLFYVETPGVVYLSISIDAILSQPRVSGEFNRAALAEYLNYQKPFLEETFFSSINRLPPGHLMRIGMGNKDISRYWYPLEPGKEINWLEDDEIDGY